MDVAVSRVCRVYRLNHNGDIQLTGANIVVNASGCLVLRSANFDN